MLGSRSSRSLEHGGARTRFTVVLSAVILMLAVVIPAVFADAGNPILNSIRADAVFHGGQNDPVTVYVRGQWNWLSHNTDCNVDRAATGAGIIWNDPNGRFVGTNEVQRITLSGTTAGATFTVKFKNPAGLQTTSGTILSSDSALTLDGKLEAMPSIGAGNVNVTGGPGASAPWFIEFTGALGEKNVNALQVGTKSGGLNVAFATTTAGVEGDAYNGWKVSEGTLTAYVGTKTATSGTGYSNPVDRMVHPVDRGNVPEGYIVAGTDYPAAQAFVDPASNNPADYLTWKGGCGRTPISAIASKGSHPERTGRNCGTDPASSVCLNHPWGSWGYEKVQAGGVGYSHTYRSFADITKICVNFYDVHGGGTGTSAQLVNRASEITVDGNGDNSIQTNMYDATEGLNCVTVNFPEQAAIHIEKDASPAAQSAGGPGFTYDYTVTNTGNVPLSNVGVTDDKCTPVTSASPNAGDTNLDGKLDTTETWTFSCGPTTHPVGSTTNIATATGTSPTNVTVTDTDQETVNVVDAKISVTPLTATNEVGDPHQVTATVQQNTGSGFVNAPDGTTVTFSLLNNTAGATFTAGSTCTTTGGSCSVSINSSTPGTVDIHATTTFTVGGVSLTRSTGSGGNNSADGSKTYVDAKIAVDPLTANNEINDPHQITATVMQDTGTGTFVAAPDGTTVTFSLLNNTAGAAFVGGIDTCTTTAGTCSVSINSTAAGSVDIHATTTFSVGGVSLTRATGSGGLNSADANKKYVDAKISVTPLTATNEINDPHEVTATVQQDKGDGLGFVNAPNGTLVTFSLENNTAGATFTAGNTCTTTAGSCSVFINSTTTGSVDIRATSTVNVSGVSVTRTTNSAGNGDDGNKDYVDAKISLTPLEATNEVGDNHTVTATVQQDLGDGFGFVNAPDGTLVTFSLLNNDANASFVGGNACTTTAGQCSVTINSTETGTVDIHATTTFNIGTPPISVTRSTNSTGNSLDAEKTYVDAKISVSPLTASNEVGDPHQITATVMQDTGTGTFVAAPDGTTVNFSLLNNAAGAGFVGGISTCNTTGGSCSVSINSTTAGSVDIRATTTFDIGTPAISVTRTTGSGGNNSADANKLYVDASISLDPLTATNTVGDPHTITATVQQNTGTGFTNAPDGTLVTFSLLNNTATADFVGGINTCTTTAGSCSVSINAFIAGGVDIHATTTFTVSGVSLTRATGTGAPNSADAHKDYIPAGPEITTAQDLLPNDSATLTGGVNPTGTITFELFGPGDPTCAGTADFDQTVTVNNGNDTYSTTNTTFHATTEGTWRWLVTYSGDGGNDPFTLPCGEEQFSISNS